jgi:hypothetical protein
MNHDNGIME